MRKSLRESIDRSEMTAVELKEIGYPEAIKNLQRVQVIFGRLSIRAKTDEGKELFVYGISRRINTLKASLNRILDISPPTRIKKLKEQERADLTAHLHCFFINHFGVYNNLALIWCYEKLSDEDKEYFLKNKNTINIFNKKFMKFLPLEFVDLINQFDVWYKNLIDFRHPLAHSIPFYVIPSFLSPEDMRTYELLDIKILRAKSLVEIEIIRDLKDSLGEYKGGHISGSFTKNKVMTIHQVIADTNTAIEILKIYAKMF